MHVSFVPLSPTTVNRPNISGLATEHLIAILSPEEAVLRKVLLRATYIFRKLSLWARQDRNDAVHTRRERREGERERERERGERGRERIL